MNTGNLLVDSLLNVRISLFSLQILYGWYFSLWILNRIFLTRGLIRCSPRGCILYLTEERRHTKDGTSWISRLWACFTNGQCVCDKCLPLWAAAKSKSPHSPVFKPTPFVPVVSGLFGGCSPQISRSCREPGPHLFAHESSVYKMEG